MLIEWALCRRFGRTEPLSADWAKTIEKWKTSSGRGPRIRVLKHATPEIWGVRSLFSSGTLLISQGLLDLSTEASLRPVLLHAMTTVGRTSWVRVSWGAFWASVVVNRMPKQWVRALMREDVTAKPKLLGGVGFFLLYPYYRLATRLSQTSELPARVQLPATRVEKFLGQKFPDELECLSLVEFS